MALLGVMGCSFLKVSGAFRWGKGSLPKRIKSQPGPGSYCDGFPSLVPPNHAGWRMRISGPEGIRALPWPGAVLQ